jgi:hypothetical protein
MLALVTMYFQIERWVTQNFGKKKFVQINPGRRWPNLTFDEMEFEKLFRSNTMQIVFIHPLIILFLHF